MRRLGHIALMLPVVAALLWSCSTTSRLPEGEVLYTGVKKVEIESRSEQDKVPGEVASQVKRAVAVKPNNALTPSIRYPFPLGLWVWNHWKEPEHGGLEKWIYNSLVEQPVLVSDVRPDLRVHVIDRILNENGYFRGSASYELVQGKNPRKASILYRVDAGPEYRIDSVGLLPDTCRLFHLIDSVAMRSPILRKGERYSTDSLAALRVRITNAVRNRGYYFFRPELIEYLADTLITPGSVALRLVLASNVPKQALQEWRTGRVTTIIRRNDGGGVPDTFDTRRSHVILMEPSKLRRKIIDDCIAFRQGRRFSVRDMNNTQTYLSRLGIFNSIEINAVPDTLAAVPTLDVLVDCTFDRPWEASIEVNVSSKSNSYLGPGLIFGLTNRNIFGGGEQLSFQLTGSYEWQTGSNRSKSSVFNSYELGLTTSLAFPRLLAPGWLTRRRRVLNWTRFSISGELLNRPRYFRLAQFSLGMTYDWQYSRHVSNQLTVFKLSYNKLLHTTASFDSIMVANPAIALSFRNLYVPQMQWMWTYDRALNHRNNINLQLLLQEAGNGFWAAYRLFGVKGEKKLFGTPFSQFVKGQFQAVWNHRMSRTRDIWLVSRALIGAAHAYGNSSQVPYSEQFYIGGANSIRAFTVRALGPGSFNPGADVVNGYFDQTGTFKLEANVEFRFPIAGPVHGACFLDAGNIWLLRDDPQRPGGTLRGRTFLNDIALGTGVGLRLDISMLVVRADLGIALHAPYDTGRSGYFNMPLTARSLALHLAIGYPF